MDSSSTFPFLPDPVLHEKCEGVLEGQQLIAQAEATVYFNTQPHSEEAVPLLEKFVRKVASSNSTPPPFKLVIEGFIKRKPTLFHDSPHSRVFAFAISLPTPVSSTFYSMPNDAPCLRGSDFWNKFHQSMHMTGANIGVYGLERAVTDIVGGTTSSTLEVSPRGEIQTEYSDSELEEKWNTRVKEMKLPPWIPMVEPSSDEETQVQGSRLGEGATSTLEECLRCFVQDKCRNSKHLIAPQSIYGWDQAVLLKELEPLIHEANKANEGSDGEQISYLKVQLQLPPPMLHLHDDRNVPFSLLKVMARLPPSVGNKVMLAFSLLSLFVQLSSERHKNLSLVSLLLFFAAFVLFHLRHHPSVHNSIGLAWSMKDWVETNFSNEMSEDEVKEKLTLENGRIPQVKLSNKKWYRQAGTAEKEWVDRNKERIRAAIRDRTFGELENEKDIKF